MGGTPPEDLRGAGGELEANPRWFMGDRWRLELDDRRGDHRLRIGTTDPNEKSIKIELTDGQAAKLAVAGLGGELQTYAEAMKRDDDADA